MRSLPAWILVSCLGWGFGLFVPMAKAAGPSPAFDRMQWETGDLELVADRAAYAAMDRDGDLLAIGVPEYHSAFEDSGAVLLYRWQGDSWKLEDTLIGSEAHSWFGATVIVDQDSVIVAAPGPTGFTGGLFDGALFFYERGANGWRLEREIRGHLTECFSYAMAQRGEWLVVADPCADVPNVRVYKRGHVWIPETTLTEQNNGAFGLGVAVSNDHIFVTGGGNLSVFALVNDEWSLVQTLPGFLFSSPLEATGDTLIAVDDSRHAVLLQENAGTWTIFDDLGENSRGEPRLDDSYAVTQVDGEVRLFELRPEGAVLEFSIPRTSGSATSLPPEPGFDNQWIYNDQLLRRDGADWTLQTALDAPGSGAFRAFGSSVALDGDVAVATAPGSVFGLAGRSSIYERIGGSWQEVLTVGAEDLEISGECGQYLFQLYGWSSAVSGDTVFIGAVDDSVFPFQGFFSLFRRTPEGWQHTQTFCGSSVQFGTDFPLGNSIAVEGNTAVAVQENELVTFRLLDGSWVLDDTLEDDTLTRGVAFSGQHLLAGLGQSGLVDEIAVYQPDGGSWSYVQTLTPDEPLETRGRSFDIDGDLAVLGYPMTPDLGRGAVFTFVYDGSSWQQRHRLAVDNAPIGLSFGSDVALDGTRMVVTADRYIRTYSWEGSTWNLERELVPSPAPVPLLPYGWHGRSSVALDGDDLLLGAPRFNLPGFQGGGAFFFGATIDTVFSDDFESGDFTAWSRLVN